MSEYTEAVVELVALPRRLDEQVARSRREVASERERREAEIEAFVEEHEAVLARLEGTLERARAEGVDLKAGRSGDGRADESAGAEPLEYARQLVGRLEEALRNLRYTRDALAAEEAKLSEEERRRAAEERRRREKEELRRGEQWERARQGSIGLAVALGAATVAGMLAAATGSAAMLVVPVVAAATCFGLALQIDSTLPALAVQRASGSAPPAPVAPARETRLAAAAYAALALACGGLGAAAIGFAIAAPAPLPLLATLLTCCGALGLGAVWWVLPRAE